MDREIARSLVEYAIKLEVFDHEIPDEKISVTHAIMCPRKSFYILTGRKHIDEVYPPVVLFIGKSVHSIIQRRLRIESIFPYDFEFEKEVEDDILVGHIDIVAHDNGKANIIELKTIRKAPKKPPAPHLKQVQTYIELLRQYNDVNSAHIVYIGKMDSTVRAFTIKPNKDIYLEVRQRAMNLKEHIENNTPPEPEPNPYCYLCDFYHECKELLKRR